MKLFGANRRACATRRGTATLVVLMVVVTLLGMTAAILTLSLGSSRERSSQEDRHKALFNANSGVAHAVANLIAEVGGDIGAAEAPEPFSDGGYWAQVVDNDDDTFTVTSTGTVRRERQSVEAVVARSGGGIYHNAIFAGNTSEDPLYTLPLGGNGAQADHVLGSIYSGGDVDVTGDAVVTDQIRAAGEVHGAPGEGGVTQPIPDLEAMDYPNTSDYDVYDLFVNGGMQYRANNAGGSAWQVAESNPAHIFRANPSDRSAETSSTEKVDFFLEDPYETIQSDYDQDGSHATHITLSGNDGNPGPNGNRKVYYVDGNLWLHNRRTYSFRFYTPDANGMQVTFVVSGNIYFSDNLFYLNPDLDGLAFIALEDENVADSGNIYFGDPEFGTLRNMQAFMYAENNFYDNNLSADGSTTVQVDGNMTAGNKVEIQRDYGDQHTRLLVNFDDRIATEQIKMPGLPGSGPGGSGGYRVVSWRKVALP
jgi:Tfp pilus assembly protein PilX